MGYCMDLTENKFKIKKENEVNVLKALKDFAEENTQLRWVDSVVILEANDVFSAFEEIRYPLEIDANGDLVLEYFSGEKLGDDKLILNSIAKYVEPNSYLQFSGEDGEIFRYVFNGETCEEKAPKISWE
ncbi:hypothetical protein [Clostridium estertheticum]|uniref:hypothetical protein n=1 Tax=Clostridium estertheticum TaxID=238834 RepID=UPI001C7D3CAF|nr:hypothetical protein [Clostridium estertheticum]MBX4266590.1 hypothetical protein [Clostridium estertheticum]WLC88072.1 hypothetical protein KTC95_18945 [Clostridium estertheticum]